MASSKGTGLVRHLLDRLATVPQAGCNNVYRGTSWDMGFGRLYGGAVVAQALDAIQQTVSSDRRLHSCHSYFLRPGKVDQDVDYEVSCTRDGGSFSTRRVVATQGNGKPIFVMTAQHAVEEDGYQMEAPHSMDGLVPPDDCPAFYEVKIKRNPRMMAALTSDDVLRPNALDVRFGEMETARAAMEASMKPLLIWTRVNCDEDTQRARMESLATPLFAYASDISILRAAVDGLGKDPVSVQMASLDHSIYIHRPLPSPGEWLLYRSDCLHAGMGRALCTGRLYTRSGSLLATTFQEGLIRPRRMVASS